MALSRILGYLRQFRSLLCVFLSVYLAIAPALPAPVSAAARPPASGPVAIPEAQETDGAAFPWLDVRVDPAVASPGDRVQITVSVHPDVDLPAARLVAHLPERGLQLESLPLAEVHSAEAAPDTLLWEPGWLGRGAAQDLAFSFVMGEDAADLSTIRFSLEGQDSGAATATAVIKRPVVDTEATVTPDEGGVLTSADGRVQVTFPAGAADAALRVRHHPVSVDLLPAPQAGLALQFELTAATEDALAESVRKFEKPLELRVDLGGLVNLAAMPMYQHHFLGYWDEASQAWEGLVARREGNVLVAQLDHFTIIGAGATNVSETGWVLAFNDASVSTFNGALTYEYPLETLDARDGLRPDLRLSYNSRRVDGALTWMQSDWAGLGWTLDTMEIARKVTPSYSPAGGKPAWYWDAWVDWANEFTLLYNGTGYRLRPATGGAAYGRYRTEDEQFLYIERRNALGSNGSPVNETGEYWIVRLRDGTEYRLGYNEDSEQRINTNYYDGDVGEACHWTGGQPPTTESCYAGHTQGKVAFRWRVDQVVDTRGDRMIFAYEEEEASGTPRERASYLRSVRFHYDGAGYFTEVWFDRATRGSDGITDDVSPDSEFYYFYQDQFLRTVRVRNWNTSAGSFTTVREYLLNYTDIYTEGHNNHTRLLQSITEYGIGGVAANHSLPATTFGYTKHWSKGYCADCVPDWEREVFRYERLTSISNGYGGTISATYDTPDSGWWHAFNYRVAVKTVTDGQGGGYKIAYAYASALADRGYENNNWYGCDYFQAGQESGGNLVGYHYVNETRTTLADAALRITEHQYKLNTEDQPDRTLGRELQSEDKTGAGAKLIKTVYGWAAEELTPGPVWFVRPTSIAVSTAVGGSYPATAQLKREMFYETSRQGDQQFGNLTQLRESNETNLYRITQWKYYPNVATDKWIVDRAAEEKVLDGASTVLRATKYYYDGSTSSSTPPTRGNLTKEERTTTNASTFQTSQTITYTNSNGPGVWLPRTVADGNGNTTTISWQAQGFWVASVSNAKGHVTSYTRDPGTWAVTAVDPPNTGDTVSYEYDYWDRLTKVIRPGDTSTHPTLYYEYCDSCSPFKTVRYERITAGQGASVPFYQYANGLGQIIQENHGSADTTGMYVTNRTFNALGLVEREYLPYAATFSASYVTPDTSRPRTVYAYDALGRTTSVTNPDSTAVRTFYDGTNSLVLNEQNQQVVYQNDFLGRLTAVKEYSGTYANPSWAEQAYATTTYAYDRLDLLAEVTDTDGKKTTVKYDSAGRKTALTDPDLGAWKYEYDAADNLITQTDARGQTTHLYYDSLNRITGKYYCAGCGRPTSPTMALAYSYDSTDFGNLGIGYRTLMRNNVQDVQVSFMIDARGRVTGSWMQVGSDQFVRRWTYNSRDQEVTQTYPGGNAYQEGEVVTTSYDWYGRPKSLVGNSTYVYADTTYDPLGRLDYLRLGNDYRTDYVYYAFTQQGGRLQQIKTGTSGSPTATQYLTYEYSGVGNVTKIVDNRNGPQTISFGYDNLNRLTSATATGGSDTYSQAYAYAKNGNITSFAGSAYAYDAARPHALSSVAGTQTYWYDANGNVTSRKVGSNTWNYTYDGGNWLTAVSGAGTAAFLYDADGNRAKSTIGGASVVYVGEDYEWRAGSGVSYYYFAGQRVAMRDSAGVTYLHADHLSSTTNTTGARSATQRYLPYGARRGSGTVATAYRYTGQWEAEALGGIYHYRARWYDPTTGRFLQPDPLVPSYQNPQSLNRYSYVLGNPLKYNDPSGNLPAWLHFSLGAGYGILNDMTWGITGRVLRDWEQEQQYDFQRGAAAGARVAQGAGLALTAHGLATAVTVTGGGAIVTAASGGAAAVVAVPVVLAVDAVAVAEAAYGVSIVAAAAGRPPRVPTYGEGNFPANLEHRVPKPTGGEYHAHHMLPKKFAERFQRIGINVHDPRWGAWVDKAWHVAKGGVHGDYNRRWAAWLDLVGEPTLEQTIAFAEELAVEYTIPWGP